MKTLQEDIDDLDRMVDAGAAKDAIRSQIRLIAREVAALQAEFETAYASMQDRFTNLDAAHTKLTSEHDAFKKEQAHRDAEAWRNFANNSYIEPTYGAEK